MRIAIYYHNKFGRNDGPPLYWYEALKRSTSAEVVHLVPEGDTRKFGKFDLHFWIDYGEDGLPVDHEWRIPDDGGKTIYVASDSHIDNGYRYEKAKQFDFVFFNQKRFVEEWNSTNADKKDVKTKSPSIFLPHAAEPIAYPKFEILKKWDVGFIGHVQNTKNFNDITRIEFLDHMFKAFPNFYFGTRQPNRPELNMFEDASKKYSQMKVCLNVSIKDDLNMRLFEILCSGSFQLTNWLPTLSDLFEDGKHLVTYKTPEEAVEKTQYYLEHEDEREKIAESGHQEFLKLHTYEQRIKTIFKTLNIPFPEIVINNPTKN